MSGDMTPCCPCCASTGKPANRGARDCPHRLAPTAAPAPAEPPMSRYWANDVFDNSWVDDVFDESQADDVFDEFRYQYTIEDVYDGPVPAPVYDGPVPAPVEVAPVPAPVEDALMVIWYPQVNLPKPTVAIFADEGLLLKLCDLCRTLKNLVFKPEGGLAQTLCLSCRTVVGRHRVNHCHSGHDVCETFRFVGPIGDVAPLCRACHQYEEGLRRTRRNGQRNRNGKRCGGSGFPLSAYVK